MAASFQEQNAHAMIQNWLPVEGSDPSSGEQLDQLLVDVMGAPHVAPQPKHSRNQPAEGSTASSTASGIVAAYREDPEVLYPAAPQKVGPDNSKAKAELGRRGSGQNQRHVPCGRQDSSAMLWGLRFADVGFSVVDKGLPCLGGGGGVKEILRSVTGQVFRGDSSSSP